MYRIFLVLQPNLFHKLLELTTLLEFNGFINLSPDLSNKTPII